MCRNQSSVISVKGERKKTKKREEEKRFSLCVKLEFGVLARMSLHLASQRAYPARTFLHLKETKNINSRFSSELSTW